MDIIKTVELAKQGNQEAFTKIYEQYYEIVFKMACKYCRNEIDAKDVTQETFVTMFKTIQQLQNPQAFYLWVKRIVVSQACNYYRKEKTVAVDPQSFQQNAIQETRKEMDTYETYHYQSEREILYALMKNCSKNSQEILKLLYLEQRKINEVAKILDIPSGTVKSRSVKAKKELQEQIQQFEKENGRKLDFHQDALFATMGIGIIGKPFFTKTKQFLIQNPMVMVSGAAVVMVSVAGGSFIMEDIQTLQNLQQAQPQTQTQEQVPVESVTSEQQNSYPKLPYREKTITNSKEAYYTIINVLKQETIDEETIEEIRPIYEALKKQNDAYWNKLQMQENLQLLEA